MSCALIELGLDPLRATREELKARYRHLASVHHPDKGGTAAGFNKLQQSYTQAKYELSMRKCVDCNNGRVVTSLGFVSASVQCKSCGGTGKK